ncbi:hypothetical protein A0H76_1118 [Hepatospora eriocheir]|uniref:tRNA-intron lyase n=1 Tax=Hepatospora eriocheir TaxID=1081669 RepID=A0A1X0QC73_9MICR|nr:hypothetical protein A0H76_1118 [Hepatospora eriocheir]ORD97367.1 hypothetical protein HERIO_788 [Hepatospora eriocheir]
MIDKQNSLKLVKDWIKSNNLYYTDGIKYGMDLLLYLDDPDKVHSTYGLIIYNEQITYEYLIALQRVCASCKKVLLIVKVGENEELEFLSVKRFNNL